MSTYSRTPIILSLLLALILTACPTGPSISSFTATPSSLPAGGGSVKLEWTTTNADSLSIDQGVGAVSGTSTTVNVTASKTFTLTVTNAHSAATATASVTVAPASTVASLELTPGNPVLDPSKTQAFTVIAKDASGNVLPTPALTWASSDATVASVDGTGLASAVASGVSAITARAGGVTSNAVNLIVRPSGILSYSLFNSTSSSYQVHQTKLDGSQDVKIADGWNPHFSPDGKFVAYQRDGTYPFGYADSLYVFDLGSVSEKKVVTNSDNIVSFGWTPDSQNLVFDVACSIYNVKRDGTGAAVVRNNVQCYDDAPSVNPVNGKIAFHNVQIGGLWTMNADGKSAAVIPNSKPGDAWPTWSPDGQWISFIRCDQSKGLSILKGLLYKIHPDGSGLSLLVPMTFDFVNAYVKPTAGWTPDSKFVVAAMVNAGTSSVQLVDAGGSGAMAPVPVANPDKVDFIGNTVASTP